MDIDQLTALVRTPHKRGKLVLAPTGRAGDFDSHAVDCPFVFRHDGCFRMTYAGFDGEGYRTGIASSDDLIHWQRDGLLIDRGPVGSRTQYNVALTWILRDDRLHGTNELIRVDGRYLGTYHSYPHPGYEQGPAFIGLCWSDDLVAWELGDPVLDAADGSGWERGGLYKSCIVQRDGAYYLFYNAKNHTDSWIEQTGVATSTDLVTWERFAGNPVLPTSLWSDGSCPAFDDRFASDPCVVWIDPARVWAMFYFGLSSDGHARDGVAFSYDMLTWTKAPEILVDVGSAGSIDERYAHKPFVLAHNGRVFHFYCAVAPNPGGIVGEISHNEMRGISVATS